MNTARNIGGGIALATLVIGVLYLLSMLLVTANPAYGPY